MKGQFISIAAALTCLGNADLYIWNWNNLSSSTIRTTLYKNYNSSGTSTVISWSATGMTVEQITGSTLPAPWNTPWGSLTDEYDSWQTSASGVTLPAYTTQLVKLVFQREVGTEVFTYFPSSGNPYSIGRNRKWDSSESVVAYQKPGNVDD